MSGELHPIAPHLAPLAAAFDAAEQRSQEAVDYEADRKSIVRAFKKGGMKGALKVGRTYGWRDPEIKELFAESAASPTGATAAAGGDGVTSPPPPAEPSTEDLDEPAWEREKNPIRLLPADCPVTPLGILEGNFHYLTPNRELAVLRKHGADDLRALFAGRGDWLWSFFPKFNEKQLKQTGWKADRTADSLTDACGKKGIFDPSRRLRGGGAWKADDGGLVLHCGDQVLFAGEWRPPGFHGEHVYPGQERLPKPAEEPAGAAAARELLALLDTWNFEDDDGDGDVPAPLVSIAGGEHKLSSLLLLAWQGCAMVGGALDWRPMVWITGDAGTGKSTLQKLVAMVLGPSLVSSSDATSAGIYQAVGYSSRAAAIDEAESDPHSLKIANMVGLVRQSASGGVILRGSNDAKWKGFTARSTFLLSSIIVPPLNTQDLTRITILSLGRLTETKPPALNAPKLLHLGRQLRRRIVDAWDGWAERLEAYRGSLARAGHDARGCDQYGALLAMADVLLHDELGDDDTRAELAALVSRERLVRHQEQPSNAEAFLNHLITVPLDVFRGGTRMTIGTLVAGAAGLLEVPGGDLASPQTCAHALMAHGVFVDGVKTSATVTLPNQHAGLAQLLRETVWATKPGAATSGWQQAMKRLANERGPGNRKIGTPVNSRRHGGRGWQVPVAVFLRQDEPE